MKKLIILLFTLILSIACSTRKEVILKQIATDREVVIRADTANNRAIGIRFPFVFEFMNPLKEGKIIEDAIYYYHPRYYPDSFSIIGFDGYLSNGRHDAELNGELVRLTRSNRVMRGISNSEKIRHVFSPIIAIDTTRSTQSIFASYIAKMKEQKIDTIVVGTANRFIKEYADFCRQTFEGDSILFDTYIINEKGDRKIDTTYILPIKLLAN